MTPLIADIVVSVIIIAAYVIGSRRGLVKTVWNAVSWIAAVAAVFLLIQPAVEVVQKTPIADNLNAKIYTIMQEKPEESIQRESAMPKFMTENTDIIDSISEKTAEDITALALKIAVGLSLFIIMKLVLLILFAVINAISRLPFVNSTNKLLGGLLGVVNIMFVIYALCAAITLMTDNEEILGIINSSYVIKYFYDNNILMQLMLRI